MESSFPPLSPAGVLLLDLGREPSARCLCLADLARFLKRRADFNPVLAFPAASPLLSPAQREGLAHCVLPSAFSWDPRNTRRLVRLLPSPEAPCLLHSHDAGSASLAARLARRLPGAVTLHTLHLPPAPGKAGRGDARHKADALIAVSEHVRKACGHASFKPEDIRLIRSGLDPERVPERRERGDGRFVFMAHAPLTSLAGWDTLLEAMALLGNKPDLPGWELRAAGGGGQLPALLDLAQRLGAEKHLALFNDPDQSAFLREADALLAPCLDDEEAAFAVRRAWAASLPLVAAARAATLELVTPERNGLTYPPGNADALAARMARLIREPELRIALVLAGRASLQAVTARRAADAHARLYRELLASRLPAA